jgi:hypothetical protein
MAERKKGVNRITKIFLTDYAALLCMLGSTFTGVLLWLFIGKGVGEEKYLWGWHRHEWGDLHLYFSLVFVALFVLHFVQHWKWIRAVAPKQAGQGPRARGFMRIAITTVLTLGIVFALFAAFRGETGRYGEEERGRGGRRGAAGERGSAIGPGWRVEGGGDRVDDRANSYEQPVVGDVRRTGQRVRRRGRWSD